MAKTIIITGAGRGVGKSCAERFLKEGWSVGLIGRNPDPLTEMEKMHENAMALPCDVADADAVDAAFEAFAGRFGRLDALFNNAGITLPGKPIDEVDVDDWRSLIDINLTGSFICARKAFGLMRLQKLGKAGAARWRGVRPTVRGVAMNPVDHPHGGGEGRTSGGRHPVTPWGVPTKGYKTRKNKRTDGFIVRRRNKK